MSSPGERQARRLAAEQRTAPTRRHLARGFACGLALLCLGAAGAWTGIVRAQVPSRLPLAELRAHPQLAGLRILQRGNRLSITPVEADEWDFILTLIGKA